MKNNIEILAPAGDIDSFKCAINNGANAIYLGMSKFNARAKSQSFNEENIKEYVDLAHLFSVKVYLTINTLIKDEEISDFLKLVEAGIKANIDAFIIQDFGMAKLLKECFPNIVLHGSTQMGIHNYYGAKLCQDIGFKRIVLSRETTLDDIKEIKEKTNLEIEYFVQGALCVAFSGNCYFSSILHQNSGNRGRCLQLCRLQYKAEINNKFKEENYLLSPSDLCLIKNLKKLIECGVTSFKIEGRMKRPAYVAQCVKSYKLALENIDKNFNINKEISKLYKVFNRGNFNEKAYLNFDEQINEKIVNKIINKTNQNHKGIFIGKGKIINQKNKFKDLNKYEITTSHNLKTNDGIKLFFNEKEIASFGVGSIKQIKNNTYEVLTKSEIERKYFDKQFDVNLTLDKEFEDKLTKFDRKIKIKCQIQANIEKNLKITLIYNDFKYTEISDYICPKSQKIETTKEEIITQISKTNDTFFEIKDFDLQLENVFIPKSVLNNLRRNALENFKEIIIKNNSQNNVRIDYEKIKNYETLLTENFNKTNNFNIIITDKIIQEKIDKNYIIIYSPKVYNLENINTFFIESKKTNKDNSYGLNLPIILNFKDKKILCNIIDNIEKDLYLYVNNYYGLYFSNNFKIITSPMLNVLNNFSINHLKENGATYISYSIELNKENIKNKDAFIYSYGYFPLMTFCHCPYITLKENEYTNCQKCLYEPNLKYKLNNSTYSIERYKLFNCYFELLNDKCINILSLHTNPKIIDIRHSDKNTNINKIDGLTSNYTGLFYQDIK